MLERGRGRVREKENEKGHPYVKVFLFIPKLRYLVAELGFLLY